MINAPASDIDLFCDGALLNPCPPYQEFKNLSRHTADGDTITVPKIQVGLRRIGHHLRTRHRAAVDQLRCTFWLGWGARAVIKTKVA